MPTHYMTKSDSSRVQSSQARSGGDMSSKGFAAHAQSAGDRWADSSSTSHGSNVGDGSKSSGHGASSGGGQQTTGSHNQPNR